MRIDVVFVLTSLLGMTDALRRSCRYNPQNWGEGWYYTASGDTLNTVAADFCVSPNVVAQWSGRHDDFNARLPSGINLRLPCRSRRRDCRRNSPNRDGAYVIVSGDTLNSIAGDFCTTANTLAAKNSHLIKNKDSIRTGWVIQVPCGFNQ
ncbi:hypothetical protein GGP41_002655 [Bipolaris sorokiniana]|uniref:LysM domain-containing protein n=2 Tax=Cochliobolus sativus TaxID=45130 RepID=A0A8H5ZH57_COCSA|nr:uncharacterized protein COCSADRAFT_28281 [Bipolaris sorokiniana ND90Pr]EMD61843.1 hypothetical protein COCSADRAFT_28281 [Bipolaris sorokiniana ND90Pr]KAF5850373.1 hypothetical protein GGP41_002655 [Bipolaris sorokiniana]